SAEGTALVSSRRVWASTGWTSRITGGGAGVGSGTWIVAGFLAWCGKGGGVGGAGWLVWDATSLSSKARTFPLSVERSRSSRAWASLRACSSCRSASFIVVHQTNGCDITFRERDR